MNKSLIGGWEERTIEATGGTGVALQLQARRKCSERCATEIESEGQIVAMFTNTDVTDRRKYWLGTVTKMPYKCSRPTLCPSSGEQMQKGERVFHVAYLDNIGLNPEHDRTYHKSDAREYILRGMTPFLQLWRRGLRRCSLVRRRQASSRLSGPLRRPLRSPTWTHACRGPTRLGNSDFLA